MISLQDHRFFAVAQAVANTSTHDKAQIGAIIVKGKDIVAAGVNGNKSHPLQQHYNKFRFNDHRAHHLMHAELDAIIKSRKYVNISGSSIYVARTLRNGEMGMSRPCKGCSQALKDYQIRDIFYTTEQGYAYEEVI